MSVIESICGAVVTTINAATWTETFAATRAYVAVYDLTSLATLHVTVVPLALAATQTTLAGRFNFDWQVGVYVQKRTDGTTTDIDPLMDLVQTMVDLFRGRTLAGYPSARCMGVELRPVTEPSIIDEHRVFSSVLVLTFRETR